MLFRRKSRFQRRMRKSEGRGGEEGSTLMPRVLVSEKNIQFVCWRPNQNERKDC
jgi:Fic family protein